MPLKLGYWSIGGIAEPIRMLLHILGQEYENITYVLPEDWAPVKKQRIEDGYAFMNIPYLEDGDVFITESTAIPYYLCKKFNKDLYGKNFLDTTRIIQINGVIRDLDLEIVEPIWGEGPKEKISKSLSEGGRGTEFIAKLGSFLGEKEFVLGYLTYIDLKLAYYIFFCRSIILSYGLEDPFAKHPNLLQLAKRIYEHDILKGYIGSENQFSPHDSEQFPWYKDHPLP